MTATPKTHCEAYAANHNGYRTRLDQLAADAAEVRATDWYREYLRANLPAEEAAAVREP